MEMKLTADNKKLLWILILALISLILCSNAFAGGLKLLHEKRFDVNPGETLQLETATGDVIISTWAGNEVFVKVYGNRKAEEDIEFSFERTSDGVLIIAEKDGGFFSNWFSSIDMKFEIQVPANFQTDIKTSGGDISVKDLSGKMSYKTSGGDVELDNTNGELFVKTSGGDIGLNKHNGNAQIQTSGGDIKCNNTKGNLEAGTSGGGISLKAVDGMIDANTSGGDITLEYTGKNMGVDLTTSGGDIKVYLPADFKADVELKSSGGSIECDYSMSKTYKVKSNSLDAEFNGGGEKLYCRTSGGDVKVKEK
ncbi:MAG: DUF4097 family beta strand repeat-containing protein [bacterium]